MAGCCLVVVAAVASEARGADGQAALALVQQTRRACPRVLAGVEFDPEMAYCSGLTATQRANELEVLVDESCGNGIDSGWYRGATLVRLDGCREVSLQSQGADRQLAIGLRIVGRPSVDELTRLQLALGVAAAEPASPEHAAGRMVASTASRRLTRPSRVGWSVSESDAPDPPSHAGPPRGSPALYWPAAVLRALGITALPSPSPMVDIHPPPRADAVETFRIAAPTELHRHRDWIVWSSPTQTRTQGRYLALSHDGQHRWIGILHDGADVQWLGGTDDLLFGTEQTDHPAFDDAPSLFVIDTARGCLHKFSTRVDGEQMPVWVARARLEGNALQVTTLNDESLTIDLGELRRLLGRRH